MLDYDKKFLLKSADNLTFDGSSIRGFSQQAESDLRLAIDWPAFYWLPVRRLRSGQGAGVRRGAASATARPTRPTCASRLKAFCEQLFEKDGTVAQRRQRDRGLPLQGPRRRAPLPRDRQLRVHLDRRLLPLAAGRRRCASSSTRPPRCSARWASPTRRTTPRSRPSQFEMNYSYTEAMIAADQVQLYKLLCRQVAAQHGHDRVLPAQAGHRRQRQRHAHQHVARPKGGKNLFYDKKGQDGLSELGWDFIDRILDQRQRHLPGPQLERQLLPPARPALRGAEPDQGLGRSTAARWSASRSATRSRRASRCARSPRTPTRTGDLHAPAHRPRGPARRARSDGKRQRTRFLPDNIYDAHPPLQGQPRAMRGAARRGGARQVRRAEAGLGRPLPQGARHAGQAPPRSSSTTR